MENEEEIFICDCHSIDHVCSLSYWPEDNIAYFHIKLNNYSFWSRLKKGLAYIFGKSNRFGHYDEFVLGPKEAKQMIEILNKIQ